jgi:hypothetical protein
VAPELHPTLPVQEVFMQAVAEVEQLAQQPEQAV